MNDSSDSYTELMFEYEQLRKEILHNFCVIWAELRPAQITQTLQEQRQIL